MSGNFRNDGLFTVVALPDGGRRFQEPSRPRHVSFMYPKKHRGKGRRRGFSADSGHPFYRDNEGDINMSDDGPSNSRFYPYGGRLSKRDNRLKRKPLAMDKEKGGKSSARDRLGGNGASRHKNYEKSRSWKKVTVARGKELGMDFVIKSIQQLSKLPFIPYYPHFENNQAVFYVDDRAIGLAIQDVSKRITTSFGFKMSVITESCESPRIPLTEKVLEKMKVIMSKRYDTNTQALDIKQFHHDPDLIAEGLYICLQRDEVFLNIVKIIEQNIPQLVSLDLSKNRLNHLKHLSTLPAKAPNLKRLILSCNNICDMCELTRIEGFQLEELSLDKNPLHDHFRDHSTYIRMIRQHFPRVTKLDNLDLPPPIVFDVETTTPLPPIQRSFFINEEAQAVIIKFLEQYFIVYDSFDRQGLLEAYHDQALFSFSSSKLGPRTNASVSGQITSSRNLLRVLNLERRVKLLRRGRLNVVTALSQLPKSKHDPNSIVVDVTCASPALLNFSVSGIYKEENTGSSSSNILRAFNRVFIVIPSGNSLLITNEEMFVTSATVAQVQSAFKSSAPTPSSSPVPSSSSAVTAAISSITSPKPKQLMVANFSQQSGMNEDWSLKCLEENDWDYEKAAQVFTALQSQNSIPAEAFIK